MNKRFAIRMLLLLCMGLLSVAEVSAQYDKDVFFMRGRRALADGKFTGAIENFNILSSLDTTDHWTYFFRGIAKYNLGDLRGAKNDFDHSVRINPVFTSGWHYRGITESRFGNYDQALEDINRAIDLRPGYIGLYFSRGVTYFLSRQFEPAVEDFNRYIRKEPKDPSAYLNRGASYLFLGDTLAAVNDYNKAIRLDRFDPEGYIRRGRLYAEQQKWEPAIADMNKAISLDTTNTFAYFNRAIMLFQRQRYNAAMEDLNRVLREEPGNALTLYNRGLIYAQMGAYEEACHDLSRVIEINPNNVLAYFNRASVYISMERYAAAERDYDRAIELYPDFAKAYLNRSYVKRLRGHLASSKRDYDIAQQKIRAYESVPDEEKKALADTTSRLNALLTLDADFAKKDFDNELVQYRDVNIRLRPLYRVMASREKTEGNYMIDKMFENPLLERFQDDCRQNMKIANAADSAEVTKEEMIRDQMMEVKDGKTAFMGALRDYATRQFNAAENDYTSAIDFAEKEGGVPALYATFYYMNRGVLRAEMIEFISSIENNVHSLSMDDEGNTRARVRDQIVTKYDYSEALEDMQKAAEIAPELPYAYFNLGNLYCLSSQFTASIENYTKALQRYPAMGDAYYNRGLVLIYIKDKEKGCIDLSRAGELGVQEAYSVIKKYCENE